MATNKVTVTLKEYTVYQGRQLKPGDEVQVDQATADRWEAAGLTGDGVRTEEQALEDKKVAELKRMAKDAGIEGYSDMDKATLVRELTAYQETQRAEGDEITPDQTITGDQTQNSTNPEGNGGA